MINQLPELTTIPVLVVLMEDEPIHQIDPITGAISHCSDYTCPCFDDEAATMEQDPEDLVCRV